MVEIRLHEGRKRQVKLMLGAVGHPVLRLSRIAYGDLRLGNLQPGQYRELNGKELARIRRRVSLTSESAGQGDRANGKER